MSAPSAVRRATVRICRRMRRKKRIGPEKGGSLAALFRAFLHLLAPDGKTDIQKKRICRVTL